MKGLHIYVYIGPHLEPNKLVNMKRYILKSNRLTDAEKDRIKESKQYLNENFSNRK